MPKPNLEEIEKTVEKKAKKRKKKDKPKMKVSGAGVKKLQRVMLHK
jgi:hypothetical protein